MQLLIWGVLSQVLIVVELKCGGGRLLLFLLSPLSSLFPPPPASLLLPGQKGIKGADSGILEKTHFSVSKTAYFVPFPNKAPFIYTSWSFSL